MAMTHAATAARCALWPSCVTDGKSRRRHAWTLQQLPFVYRRVPRAWPPPRNQLEHNRRNMRTIVVFLALTVSGESFPLN